MIYDGKHRRKSCDDIGSSYLSGYSGCHIVGITWPHAHKVYLAYRGRLFLGLPMYWIDWLHTLPPFRSLQADAFGEEVLLLVRSARVRPRAVLTALATGIASSVANST